MDGYDVTGGRGGSRPRDGGKKTENAKPKEEADDKKTGEIFYLNVKIL